MRGKTNPFHLPHDAGNAPRWEEIATQVEKGWNDGWLLLAGTSAGVWGFIEHLPKSDVRALADISQGRGGGAFVLVKKTETLHAAFRTFGLELSNVDLSACYIASIFRTKERLKLTLCGKPGGLRHVLTSGETQN
jgi:hypothetical protein